MTDSREVHINVPVMARVEGEGALALTIRDGRIDTLKLQIFEPPRLFEKFLEGRDYEEVPDIVARICGICPVAYQMSAVHALESVFGIPIDGWVRDMRRVLYCGEWIESHALHIHLLAAPDFLGFPNAIAMAEQHADIVRRGLRLQALGNRLMHLFGGRSVHPVGVRVGGFHHAPSPEEVATVVNELRAALPEAEALVYWTASLDLPDDEQSFTCVALRHPGEYPMNQGRLVSSGGLDIDIENFDSHFIELHVPHSTALHALLDGRPYLVGPLARINLNCDRLPESVRRVIAATGVRFPSRNMFHSVIARAVEVLYALIEAIRLLQNYALPKRPFVPVTPRAGSGTGCTEAPRGILWHRYTLNGEGFIRSARIVPPTSQNQARIEEDLRVSLEAYGLERNEQELRLRGETVIRNYDPCISCSTHFLRIHVDRQ
ncbi:MAG: nickel-dependent hydrogenase large subunit [Gammaproteobacteria bacterium]|nr:MAG: nickel-dependent hydrogenase large subunit [Gammaproteobacteria bacterium]TND02130.1 MAG: nickel-dependent hydrogenase large subunit [Gammaproteobacteria bacterium]